jgi:hypothetical protein
MKRGRRSNVDADSIIGDITAVTRKWTKQRKAEERRRSVEIRRATLYHSARDTVKDAAYRVMEEAYLKASSNGTLPAHARQIMYCARGPIQDEAWEPLNDKYFTQTLLPDYMSEHPSQTAGWDVVFDARGHFREPHTGLEVPLGTLEVRQYLDGGSRQDAPVRVRGLFPTHGPANRFGGVLFIEKEGFLPLFRRVRLADRYDIAVMSTKGMSVVAARRLVDQVCGRHGIPLYILHDFDKYGFSIFGTLSRDNRRYHFRYEVNVADLGLRLADVQACGLEAESVHITDSDQVRDNLRDNGATGEEIDFLVDGQQRVELNAFASRELVNWIEGKLKDHGVMKVIPDDAVLADAYREAYVRQHIRVAIRDIRKRAAREAAGAVVPADLRRQIEKAIAEEAALPWDRVVSKLARKAVRPDPDTTP